VPDKRLWEGGDINNYMVGYGVKVFDVSSGGAWFKQI